MRVAEGASFLSLGEQNAVFSEAAQKLYVLNRIAAYIWCRLEEHHAPSSIAAGLVGSGVDPELAREYVDQAIRMWLRLGLLRCELEFDAGTARTEDAFTVVIGKLRITILSASEHVPMLVPLFAAGVLPPDRSGDVLRVVDMGRLKHIFHNGRNVLNCADDELAPSVKAYLTEQIVARGPPDVALHAACLVRGNRSVLIVGPPGAGKSTLTAHLMAAGFDYQADDIVSIAPDGGMRGIPFAPTLKTGAWEMVGRLFPVLHDMPIHRRPDGKRVRYLKLDRIAKPEPYPVGWIIFIRRLVEGPAELKRLGRVDALNGLLDASFAPDRRLSYAMCHAIKQTLMQAASFELTYSNVASARDAIVSLCDA